LKKQYQKVVDQCQDFKKLMQEQDTVNLQYISILQKEVKAYKGLKDFEKVAALRESIISIIDGINSKDKQNAALELNAIHKADDAGRIYCRTDFTVKNQKHITCFFGMCHLSHFICAMADLASYDYC